MSSRTIRQTQQKEGNALRILLLVIYTLFLASLLFQRRAFSYDSYLEMVKGNVNLQPLATVKLYLHALGNESLRQEALINLFGNILLFLPYGYLLPKLFPSCRRAVLLLALTLLVILGVETLQLLTLRGIFDVDDILLNVLGVFSGYVLWRLSKRSLTV
ncbi:MAG: VanZ family protein [Erysipelotrichaceae bacterium]|nr:VanZ family protein [Erysipelotrichaceae bacterium]